MSRMQQKEKMYTSIMASFGAARPDKVDRNYLGVLAEDLHADTDALCVYRKCVFFLLFVFGEPFMCVTVGKKWCDEHVCLLKCIIAFEKEKCSTKHIVKRRGVHLNQQSGEFQQVRGAF